MHTFRLTIRESGQKILVDVETTRPGLAASFRASEVLALDLNQLKQFEHERDFEGLYAYGKQLGEAVFTGAIRRAFDAAISHLEVDSALHVSLYIEVQELRRCRWERLCGPVSSEPGCNWEFLHLWQKTAYCLDLATNSVENYPAISRVGLKALVVVADPGPSNGYRLSEFDAKATVEGIRESLGNKIGSCVLAASAGQRIPGADGLPTLDEICSRLSRERFAVLHLVCHGEYREPRNTLDQLDGALQSENYLYLMNSNESDPSRLGSHIDVVSATRFLKRLAQVRNKPHLTFMCSCSTAPPESDRGLGGIGQRLVRDLAMPAVVAMTEPVAIDLATELSKEFYQVLRDTGRVDQALTVASARQAGRENILVPALYSRLAGQPLFDEGQEITTSEWDSGLDALPALLEKRAPVLRSRFDELLAKIKPSLEIWKNAEVGLSSSSALTNDELKARDQLQSVKSDLNVLCHEFLENSFDHLANGKPLLQRDQDYVDRCPFPGLAVFDKISNGEKVEDYRKFFFGREALVKEVLDSLDQLKFVAVVGGSGSGKSSLVRAGVIHALECRKSDFRAIVFPPGKDPIERLDAGLRNLANPDLIVIDQFEEIFTLCEQKIRKQFIERILGLRNLVPVIITMRNDFRPECTQIKELASYFHTGSPHLMQIEPLNSQELRDVVQRQADATKLRFEPGLTATIFEDLDTGKGAMPLLQHCLRQLWERRYGSNLKTAEYTKLGRVQGSITRTAQDAYLSMIKDEPQTQAIIPFILTKLAKIDTEENRDGKYRDFRRREQLTELTPAGCDPKIVEGIVGKLAEAKLLVMTQNDTTNEADVELAHEALLHHWESLKDWINDARSSAVLVQEIADDCRRFKANPKQKNLLFTDETRLEKAEYLLTATPTRLTATQVEFLKICRRRLEKRARLYAGWLVLLSTSFAILATCLAGSRWAINNERSTARNSLVRLGIISGIDNRDAGWWLDAAGNFQTAAGQTDDALQKNMLEVSSDLLTQKMQSVDSLKQTGLLGVKVLDSEAGKLLVWTKEGKIELRSVDQLSQKVTLGEIYLDQNNKSFTEIRMILNKVGSRGVVLARTGKGQYTAKQVRTDNKLTDPGWQSINDVQDVAFTKDKLVTVSPKGEVQIWSTEDGKKQGTFKLDGAGNYKLGVSSTLRYVLVSSDSKILLLDCQLNEPVTDITSRLIGNATNQSAILFGNDQIAFWQGNSHGIRISDCRTGKSIFDNPLLPRDAILNAWSLGVHGIAVETQQSEDSNRKSSTKYLKVLRTDRFDSPIILTEGNQTDRVEVGVQNPATQTGTFLVVDSKKLNHVVVVNDLGISLYKIDDEKNEAERFKICSNNRAQYHLISNQLVAVGFDEGLVDIRERKSQDDQFEQIAEVTHHGAVEGVACVKDLVVSWSTDDESIFVWKIKLDDHLLASNSNLRTRHAEALGQNQILSHCVDAQNRSEVQLWNVDETSPVGLEIDPLGDIEFLGMLPREIPVAITRKATVHLLINNKWQKLDVQFEDGSQAFENPSVIEAQGIGCGLRASADGKEAVLWRGDRCIKLRLKGNLVEPIGKIKARANIKDAKIDRRKMLWLSSEGEVEKYPLANPYSNLDQAELPRGILCVTNNGQYGLCKQGDAYILVDLLDRGRANEPTIENSSDGQNDSTSTVDVAQERLLAGESSVFGWSSNRLYRWTFTGTQQKPLWEVSESEANAGAMFSLKNSERYVTAWCARDIKLIDLEFSKILMEFRHSEPVIECRVIGQGPSFFARSINQIALYRLVPVSPKDIARRTNYKMPRE